jgi:hypothetical protein
MNSEIKSISLTLFLATLSLAVLAVSLATAQEPYNNEGVEPYLTPAVASSQIQIPRTTPLLPPSSLERSTHHTSNSETIPLSAGRYRVRIGAGPQFYQGAGGAWQSVDPTLYLETNRTRVEYVSDRSLVHVRLPARLGAGAIRVRGTANILPSTTLAIPKYGNTTLVLASNQECGSSDQPVTEDALNACTSSEPKPTPPSSPPISRVAPLTVSGELTWAPLRLMFVDAAEHQEIIDPVAQVQGVSQGNVLTYSNTFSDITERFTVYPDGLKHEVILSSARALPSTGLTEDVFLDYQGIITLSPGLAICADGIKQDRDFTTASALELRDSSGESVLFLPPVVAYEQANPLNSVRGHYSIHRTSEGLLLSFGVPYDWLTDPQREYPVVVDPTVYIWPSSEDTYLHSVYPSWNFGWDTGLWVAESTNALLRWGLSSVPSMAMVDYSELIIRLKDVTGIPTVTISVHPVQSAWDENTATWITRTGAYIWSTPGGDYGSSLSSQIIYNATDTLYHWGVTDLAAEWHSGHTANNGVLLRGESSPSGNFNKIFASKEDSSSWWVPELDIHYTQGPVALTQYVPIARGVPSPDWYSLTRGVYWNAVAIRPPTRSDYDLRLSSTEEYTDTLAWSAYGGDAVDFVLIDGNHAPSGDYYPWVTQWNGRGQYNIEHATRTADLIQGENGPYETTLNNVVRVWDISLADGNTYYVGVKPIAGDADLSMALHKSQATDSTSWYQGRGSSVAYTGHAGPGKAEFFSYTAPENDWYGLVVVNKTTKDPLSGATVTAGAGSILETESKMGKEAPTNLGVTRVSQPRFYHYRANAISKLSGSSPLNILACSDSCELDTPDTCAEVALKNLGKSYDFYFQDWAGCETAINSGTYDVAIIDNACYYPENSLFTALDDFLKAGGYVMVNTFDMDAFPANPLWATAGVAYVSDVTTQPPVYRWNPPHPTISDWPADPLVFTNLYMDDGDKFEALEGTQLLAGYTTAPTAGQGAFALRDDNQAIVSGFCIDNLATSDQDDDGTLDCVEVWQDAISSLLPTSYMIYVDTTPPGGSFAINGGDTFANSVNATLNISVTDNETSIGDMRFNKAPPLRALVLQDSYPWGSNAIQQILVANNIPYDQLASSAITTTNLEFYSMVIIPSVQGDTFCNIYNNNLSKFKDYVQNGGILEIHGATYSSDACRPILPASGVNNQDFQLYNYVVSPTHPLMAGVPNPLWGNYASHNSFTGYPANATVLATAGSTPEGDATLLEYPLGSGRVIASGQTLEYGWASDQSVGTILANAIPYVAGHIPWAAAIPWVLPPSDGVKTVYGEFRNNAGMWSPVYNDTIILDSTPPSSSASSPNYDKAGDISVTWSASDGLSGVDETSLWYRRGTGGSWTDSGLTQSGTSGTFPFSPPGGINGTYYFATRATDNATNTESAPSGVGDDSTVYDTASPTASANCAPDTEETSFIVSWSGSDNLSGIASYDVQYRVGQDGTWTTWKNNTTATSATFGPEAPVIVQYGLIYFFRARAQDRASNMGQYAAGDGDCSIQVKEATPEEFRIYLPVVMRSYISYAAPCGPANNYCEDYDTPQAAYGALESDVAYSAYPDDEKDYYYFVLPSAGPVTVHVTNYQAVGQVLVRDEALNEKGKDEHKPGDGGEMEVYIPSLPAGKYYIQLYTAPGYENPSDLYTLMVTY